MRPGIVYKAVNTVNGKVYVGQTVMLLKKRIACHVNAKVGILHKALKKYGIQSFEWEIIDTAGNQKLLKEKEIFWIRKLNCKVPHGYNITDGGNGGMLGVTPSKETRKKHSESLKGKNIGEKNGMFGKPSPMKGKHHSEESKQKNREAHLKLYENETFKEKMKQSNPIFYNPPTRKGKHHTKESKEKMRQSHIGQKSSLKSVEMSRERLKSLWGNEEFRIKMSKMMSGINNPFYNKKHSEETKKKIGDRLRNKPWTIARRVAQCVA